MCFAFFFLNFKGVIHIKDLFMWIYFRFVYYMRISVLPQTLGIWLNLQHRSDKLYSAVNWYRLYIITSPTLCCFYQSCLEHWSWPRTWNTAVWVSNHRKHHGGRWFNEFSSGTLPILRVDVPLDFIPRFGNLMNKYETTFVSVENT